MTNPNRQNRMRRLMALARRFLGLVLLREKGESGGPLHTSQARITAPLICNALKRSTDLAPPMLDSLGFTGLKDRGRPAA